MKIKPVNEYREPEYPQLRTVEKKVRASVYTGKKAATFAMAVAAAVSLTTCGARTLTTSVENRSGETLSSIERTSEATIRPTGETTDLTYAGGEITAQETATAGLVYIEETALAGDVVQTETTETTYDPGIAESIVAPEETTWTTAG